jgi:phosphoribosylamine--glycine ligase
MRTADGLRVLEFDCRLGDPEAQATLGLLGCDLADVVEACFEGRLSQLEWKLRDTVRVALMVMDPTYPRALSRGQSVTGIPAQTDGVDVYHSGTELLPNGNFVSTGPCLLTVVGEGSTLEQARGKAYEGVSQILLGDRRPHYRSDIG